MKAYTYKDSGIEWLGSIPSHWKVDRLRDLSSINTDALSSRTDENLSLDYLDISNVNSLGVVNLNNIEKVSFKEAPSRARRKVEKFDTVISSVRTNLQAVAFVDFDKDNLICSTGFFVCRPKFNQILDEKYLYYFLLTDYSKDYFFSHSVGVSYPAIGDYKFSSVNLPLPPLSEQKIIAEYLDKATARVDSVLSIKRAQLHNLSLQRKSIIHEAVTGKSKLNINCETKDSGIEWLGEIPSHWTYDKLFRLCNNVGSGGTPQSTNQSYYDGEIFWVQSGDLTDGYVYDTKKKINELAIQNSSAKVFPENTLLVAMYGATIGKVGIMTFEGAINQACCALDFSSKINPKFSYYLMLNARDYLITQAYGGGQQNISQETLKQLHLFYPSVEEQKAIVDYLDTVLEKSLKLEEYIYSQIKTLQNYRKSLIHECVTGKKQITDMVE